MIKGLSGFLKILVAGLKRWLPFGAGFGLGIGLADLDEMGGIEEFVEVEPGVDEIWVVDDLKNGFMGKGIVAYVGNDLFPFAEVVVIGKFFKCEVRIEEFFFGKMAGKIIPGCAVLTPTAIGRILVEHPQVAICFSF